MPVGSAVALKMSVDRNVELSWKGSALLKERGVRDELDTDPETLAQPFRLHPRRAISYPFGNKQLRRIDDVIALAVIPV
jgi:DNA sulfur modification protein DndE